MCGWQNGDGSVENVEAVETLKMWKCGNVEKRSERSRTSEASCIDGCWRADIDKSHMNGRFGFESVSYAFHCWCFFSAYFFLMFDWVLGVGKSPDTRKKNIPYSRQPNVFENPHQAKWTTIMQDFAEKFFSKMAKLLKTTVYSLSTHRHF